jgi:uncharacterized hydrophobic protein (TIGR00271 family)
MFFLKTLSPDAKTIAVKKLHKIGEKTNKYYILTVLSVIIVTLGLILDNAAIIIGGMLIAPLMDPILSVSSTLITGHHYILIKNLKTLIKGISLSIIISTVITFVLPIYEIPSQVLVRINPSILDLFIAFAAGAAAMYATVSKDLSTLPGVGISVSLMPPLSVIGIGLATGDPKIISGATLLFLTNLVTIILSGALILFLFGIKTFSKDKQETAKTGRLIGISLLIVLSIFLTSSFISISKEEKQKLQIKTILNQQLQLIGKGELTSFTINKDNQTLNISAKILSSRNLTKEDMDILTESLSNQLESSINLEITIIPTVVGGTTLLSDEKDDIEKIRQQQQIKNPQVGQELKQPIMAPVEILPDSTTTQPLLPGETPTSPSPTPISEFKF